VVNTNTSHGADRRRYSRADVHIPLELSVPGGPPLRTVTQEISLCGCYVESLLTMEKGTKLSVGLSLNDCVIRCNGVVATKHPQVGNGIEFIRHGPK
jgi:hypothetical protein